MTDELSSTVLFDIFRDEITGGKLENLKRIKGVVVFRVTVDGQVRKVYSIDTRNFPGDVYEGEKDGVKANAVITIDDDNLAKLVLGEIDPVQGFMSAKFKVRGDILLLQKLNTVLKGARKSLL